MESKTPVYMRRMRSRLEVPAADSDSQEAAVLERLRLSLRL